MADQPTYLATQRAEKAGSSCAWTPEDALREALRRVEVGEVEAESVWVIMSAPDGTLTSIRAGTTHETTVAILEAVKMDAIREWQGRD